MWTTTPNDPTIKNEMRVFGKMPLKTEWMKAVRLSMSLGITTYP
jgi:hypothetical protein